MTDRQRYEAAMHGIQSGLAYLLERDGRMFELKHLRVGIDSAHVSDCALTRLLIAKGVFTEAEHIKALADAAEEERDRLQREIQEQTGANITLH